ncbi:MAG: hypothetical protein LBB90_12325 [Tannerella sp.]|jgi:hypothetical protein|nr:hypothetical protein [Tannerella sp.]
MVLLAADGSTVSLPKSEALKREFGMASNQQEGMENATARVSILYDVLNDIVLKDILHPLFVSEETVLPECLSGLSLDDKLLLFDRGYPSY